MPRIGQRRASASTGLASKVFRSGPACADSELMRRVQHSLLGHQERRNEDLSGTSIGQLRAFEDRRRSEFGERTVRCRRKLERCRKAPRTRPGFTQANDLPDVDRATRRRHDEAWPSDWERRAPRCGTGSSARGGRAQTVAVQRFAGLVQESTRMLGGHARAISTPVLRYNVRARIRDTTPDSRSGPRPRRKT